MVKKKLSERIIAINRRARRDFQIEETYEAGIALEGWEVKALRAGRVNLNESYVVIKGGEAWLLGCHISPLPSASSHVAADPNRTRKLILHRRELDRLAGAVERRGWTVVPLKLYWKRHLVKVEIGLAKGKKLYDKRAAERARDWRREKERLFKIAR